MAARERIPLRTRFLAAVILLATIANVASAVANYKSALVFTSTSTSWLSATGGTTGRGIRWDTATDLPFVHQNSGTELPLGIASTGVTPATYVNATVTVNAYGQVTAITPGAAAGTIPLSILSTTSSLTGGLAAAVPANTIAVVRSTGGGWITYDNANWSPLW